MDLQLVGRGRPILVALAAASAIALFAIVVSMMGVRTAEAAFASTTLPPVQIADPEPEPVRSGVAFVDGDGVTLWSGPERDPLLTLQGGITLPFLHRSDDWLLVTTMCNDTAWIDATDVEIVEQALADVPGPGFDIAGATIVLDPGHGARDWGGVGPSGLSEKEVNLDIADRVRDLMAAGRSIDWSDGSVDSGTEVPSFGRVILTRDVTGPDGGDFELGLGYRASVATAAGADALVSIHNNTVPRFDTDIPGSEVYYSPGTEGSDRLAGIIYEELLRSFSVFDADWRGGEMLGARARIDPDTGEDYYGLLRRSKMPAVIVEGVYISEPDEEALLATAEFRQAYAEAIYRGIVRFLTTDDEGSGVNRPEVFHLDAGTVSGNGCQLPVQAE